ncbi:hypothetical protein V8B97DRAFT_402622 [Scleroderma yunnanense]
MCEYIDYPGSPLLEFDPPFFECEEADSEPPVLIELGSGTGIVAARIAGSAYFPEGGIVVATDLLDVCPLLEHNLGSIFSLPTDSERSRVLVRPLAWGNMGHATAIAQELGIPHTRTLTHIICSDLVYFPELFGPLLRTLIHLTSLPCPSADAGKSIKIVISYKVRSLHKESPFWSAFGLWFTFQPVLFRDARHGNGVSVSEDKEELGESWSQFGAMDDDTQDRTFIFIAYRRPESLAWEVPLSDRDLVDGVGGRGTPARKGDDTFETLLFLAMKIVE